MKLREKIISVVVIVALVAAFVPCSGCVSGNNPTLLTSEELNAYFNQPIDVILFGGDIDGLLTVLQKLLHKLTIIIYRTFNLSF